MATARSSSDSLHPLLRLRDGHHARVTNVELFFDLVYAFAVTQLSHKLLHDLSGIGALETLILWFAVWLGWQYTCWVTNWFDPDTPPIRNLMLMMMLAGLIMASAIPDAFGDRGLAFALAYVAIQVGRTAYIVWVLGPDHPLSGNYRRMLAWLCIAAPLWICGALVGHNERVALWALAVLCEYGSPMIGFALPGFGRSRTQDWTIEGGHLAERCQLFVIVALGEALLSTGASFAEANSWTLTMFAALLANFLGTLALWWLYFGTSSKDATDTITRSRDPGRIGAYFHYVHAILVAGIIVTAVGNDLILAHPYAKGSTTSTITLVAGPVIYLVGSAIYKRIVYGGIPWSHIGGAVALAVLIPVVTAGNLLLSGWLAAIILLIVAGIHRAAGKIERPASIA